MYMINVHCTVYAIPYGVHCDTIKLHQIFTHQMCTSDAVVVFKMFAVFTISLFISVSIIDK